MKSFFLFSIGQKYLMGLTGLGLVLFVLVHMLGNLLIFAGKKSITCMRISWRRTVY